MYKAILFKWTLTPPFEVIFLNMTCDFQKNLKFQKIVLISYALGISEI